MPLLWIPKSAFDAMAIEASRTSPLETGGVLLGYRNGDSVVVEHAIGPGPKAIHQRVSFKPDNEYHRAEIARLYEEAGRQLEYLGDWHTHPGGAGVMSWMDKTCLRSIASDASARCPQPVMVILNSQPWKPNAFEQLSDGSIVEIETGLFERSEAA